MGIYGQKSAQCWTAVKTSNVFLPCCPLITYSRRPHKTLQLAKIRCPEPHGQQNTTTLVSLHLF